MIHFVLGGQRSGKSAYAEKLALENNKPVVYIATARLLDQEMAQRVQLHRQRRPASWRLLEEPRELAASMAKFDRRQCLLLDCLNMWLSNFFSENGMDHDAYRRQKQTFLQCLANAAPDLIIVSVESGLGAVPANRNARLFLDELGALNQSVAALADRVSWVVAGIPVAVKTERSG